MQLLMHLTFHIFLKQNVTDYINILALFNQKYKHLSLKKSP